MVAFLFILGIVFLFISVSLHKSADQQEAKFNNRPSTITSPSNDLFTNQKYAIINILVFAQGANSVSAYSDEAKGILNHWLSKLGISKFEMEKSVRLLMSMPPERFVQIIRDSMQEIKDKDFVRSVYRDVDRIANISGDTDTIEFMRDLFNAIVR